MSPIQKTTLVAVVAAAALAVYLSFSSYRAELPQAGAPLESGNTAEATPGQNTGTVPAHPLMELAQHHCRKLDPEAEATRCLEQIAADIAAGKLDPQVPEVNPLACNGIADPKKQHECHGRMGHDFAVSTGDPAKCLVIPQPDIKAACRRLITINEIKQLHQLETATAPGKTRP